MTYRTLSLEVSDHVAEVTLNRPDAFNTMNRAFWQEMVDLFDDLDARGDVRCVVIASTGKHFTAGLDLNDFGNTLVAADAEPTRSRERLRRTVKELQETFNVIDRCRAPVLAAVQGGCIGGGMDLITACDMRYCSQDAFFTVHEINIAITADVGTLQRLPHVVPQGIARELAYTGRRMPADEAKEVGLVNRVFADHASLLDGVRALAREIAAKSPLAVAGTKEMLNYARDHTVADGLDYVAAWNAAMLGSTDLVEAMTAQAEKRAPAYQDLLAPSAIVSRRR